jgi:hypothetical protein
MDISTLTWIDTLAILMILTLNVILGLYGLIIVRQVHREVQENLLTSRTALEGIVKLLQKS